MPVMLGGTSRCAQKDDMVTGHGILCCSLISTMIKLKPSSFSNSLGILLLRGVYAA